MAIIAINLENQQRCINLNTNYVALAKARGINFLYMMIGYVIGFLFLLTSAISVYYFRLYLQPRLANPMLVWLFSISLSLSLNFLVLLLMISIFLKIPVKF